MSKPLPSVTRLLLIVSCWLLIVGCETAPSSSLPTPILPTTATVPSPSIITTPLPSTTPNPDSGWQLLHEGFERRTIRLFDENKAQFEQLFMVRIDPALYEFQIAYSPGEPKTLAQWQTETGAIMLVNGGFFTPEFVATGLIVVDGQASGSSYGDFAGMLTMGGTGVELRWLGERPFTPNESLQYALQSFPMLVKPGGVLGFPDEDGHQARRTVVAQDGGGRLLFILAPRGGFTLHALSQYLVESDLELDVALNLDGGTSTGLLLMDSADGVLGLTAVPAVIVIFPR